MKRLHPTHWILALAVAGGIHLLLLVGVTQPDTVTGDRDGERTVTIDLGSATPATPRQPESRSESEPASPPLDKSTPSAEPAVTHAHNKVKAAPETATEPAAEPGQRAERSMPPEHAANEPSPSVDDTAKPNKDQLNSKNASQASEKKINTPIGPVGADQTAHSAAQQIASYFGELRQWLAEHRRYPRRAKMRRLEGTAVLEIELTADGQIKSSRISRSSGHQRLDEAVREMLARARPLPPPPDDLDVAGQVVNVPVDFSLR